MAANETIQVTTRMERQDYKTFLLTNTYKISWVSTLLSRAAIALACTLLIYFIRPPQNMWVLVAAFFAFFVLLLLIQRIQLHMQYVVTTKEDNLKQFDTPQTLRFGKNEITVTVEGQSETSHIAYEKIIRVVETEKYFYLYMTRKMAAIVRKKDMDTAKAGALSAFLEKKMDPYFIKKC